MDWMDDGIEPRRSHDELMQVVVQKGEAIKARRRRFMTVGGGAAVLLAALVAGILTASNRLDEARVSTAAAAATTTTLAVPPAPLDSAPFDGPVPYPLPWINTATTVATPSGAAGGLPVATTVAPRPAGGPPAPAPGGGQAVAAVGVAPTTTNPGAKLPECSRAHLAVTADTDRALYPPGQKVVLTSTLRNTSPQACHIVSYSFRSVFNDVAGRPVTLTSAVTADYFREEPFAPGQSVTQTREWDQQVCTDPGDGAEICRPAPAGSYTGAVRWDLPGGPYEASAGFALAPVPVSIP